MAKTFTPPPANDPYELLYRLQPIQPPAGPARTALVKQFKGDPLGELVATAALGPEAAKHIRAKFPKTLPSGDRAELRMFQSSPIAGALVLQPRLADAEASPADPLYDQLIEAIQSGAPCRTWTTSSSAPAGSVVRTAGSSSMSTARTDSKSPSAASPTRLRSATTNGSWSPPKASRTASLWSPS